MFYFIAGHGRGWAFSSSDLSRQFSRQQADNALSDLTRLGKIRRVARGIYDYPRFSDLLQKTVSPDVSQVAAAYARKFSWRIEVSGESALNLLGLSTQIPAQYIYLSDGPTKRYEVMGVQLHFKKTALKNIGFIHFESGLMVQALKALGKEHITPAVLEKMRSQVAPKHFGKILKDTQGTTTWVYDAIKLICQDAQAVTVRIGAQHG